MKMSNYPKIKRKFLEDCQVDDGSLISLSLSKIW